MRAARLALLACALCAPVFAADPAGHDTQGPVYVIAHLDVLPMTAGGVDFLQTGYGLLFRYRDQSKDDPGLTSFRILDLAPPTTNHSEIVQTWNSFAAYERHLALPHTTAFRFEVQNNPRFGGICCVGSPIDDRQYSLVESFGAPWPSPTVATTVGPAGAVYVISYLEFLPQGNPTVTQRALAAYGDATAKSDVGLVSFSVLRELHRPNRYALLEIWTGRKTYDAWQKDGASRDFGATLGPMLASPIDHRFTVLCGQTFVDSAGCTSP